MHFKYPVAGLEAVEAEIAELLFGDDVEGAADSSSFSSGLIGIEFGSQKAGVCYNGLDVNDIPNSSTTELAVLQPVSICSSISRGNDCFAEISSGNHDQMAATCSNSLVNENCASYFMGSETSCCSDLPTESACKVSAEKCSNFEPECSRCLDNIVRVKGSLREADVQIKVSGTLARDARNRCTTVAVKRHVAHGKENELVTDEIGSRGRNKHGNYRCSFCEFSSCHRYRLTAHISAIHFGDRKFCCSYCSKNYAYKGDLARHVMRKHSERGRSERFVCETCGSVLSSKSSLEQHKRYKHADTDWQHVCPICSRSFPTPYRLMAHVSIHQDVKSFGCGCCNFVTRTLHHVRGHFRRMHKEEFKAIGSEQFRCGICNTRFFTPKGLKSHLTKAHSDYTGLLLGNSSAS